MDCFEKLIQQGKMNWGSHPLWDAKVEFNVYIF